MPYEQKKKDMNIFSKVNSLLDELEDAAYRRNNAARVKKIRSLVDEEIRQLVSRGCECEQ